jgi:hypothetical protein
MPLSSLFRQREVRLLKISSQLDTLISVNRRRLRSCECLLCRCWQILCDCAAEHNTSLFIVFDNFLSLFKIGAGVDCLHLANLSLVSCFTLCPTIFT